MLKLTRRFALVAIALGILGMSQPAHASLTLTLSDGNPADTLTFTDTAQGTPGSITIPGTVTVGNFTVSGSANGPPTPGDSTSSTIMTSQATLNIAANGTGQTLTITETSTPDNFTPASNSGVTLTSALGVSALTGGSASYTSTAVGAASTATTPLDGSVMSVGFFSKSAQFIPSSPGPFTITSTLNYTPTAVNNQLSDTFTTTISAVPEPATLAMAFSALPLLGIAAWRHRRKAV